jgi:hypothetical protein
MLYVCFQRRFMTLRIAGTNAAGEDVETPLVVYYWR